jgi:two-component system, sensor histidine kinase and response regulator
MASGLVSSLTDWQGPKERTPREPCHSPFRDHNVEMSMNTEAAGTASAPNLLLVDDTLANLQLLTGMLRQRGYTLRPAPSGKLALKAARAVPPDLILLDIRMPEMDGYEVCRQLKTDPALAEIPVIFLSALTEPGDKEKAFSEGGVDYITKPFQVEEVIARVKIHLELQSQKRQLRANFESLQRLESLRSDLTHMIVHDLRAPLALLGDFLSLLDAHESSRLSPRGSDFVRHAKQAAAELVAMVDSVLEVSRMEAGELAPNPDPFDLVHVARETVQQMTVLKGRQGITVEAPDGPALVTADRELILRVIRNLLDNALKFTTENGPVRVAISKAADAARLTVSDDGPGIPAQYHTRIFEKFGRVDSGAPRPGAGLGLTFCKYAVEAHGGKIGVESEVGRGSTFWFTLPAGTE